MLGRGRGSEWQCARFLPGWLLALHWQSIHRAFGVHLVIVSELLQLILILVSGPFGRPDHLAYVMKQAWLREFHIPTLVGK